MPSLAEARLAVTIIQIVAYVLLLSKLFRSRLYEKYRYFSFLIFADAARLAFMASLKPRTDFYAYSYIATGPIIWILLVLVVLEFFHLILRNHIGIASIGKKAVTVALIVSAAISAGTLLLDLQRTSAEAAVLFNFMLLERLVTTSLLLLLLCLVIFASHFPVPVSRNIRTHASIFAVFFAGRTAILFLRMWFGLDVVAVLNFALQSLGAACLIAWIVLLDPAGEQLPAPQVANASERRLLEQLEAINESLLRSARK
ncbi:MAG TPA: hypothetical protein VER03_05155 [Bryobacteraceae bacterium]|nr:hypothetical protein [Bryobacteraceae bacterium]